ncbi:uncharacterized protein LOC132088294 [Daphnia carinata]|uniref:uncharacterized protein LOC132088294 n=1 Tax=Daphnia carinata TaxID=120202 RepID=UPI0028693C66|nr:uncharacterized protein LOC132088294 [Daphnia carinata]
MSTYNRVIGFPLFQNYDCIDFAAVESVRNRFGNQANDIVHSTFEVVTSSRQRLQWLYSGGVRWFYFIISVHYTPKVSEYLCEDWTSIKARIIMKLKFIHSSLELTGTWCFPGKFIIQSCFITATVRDLIQHRSGLGWSISSDSRQQEISMQWVYNDSSFSSLRYRICLGI